MMEDWQGGKGDQAKVEPPRASNPTEGRKPSAVDISLRRELLFFSALAVLAYSVALFLATTVTHRSYWDLVYNSGDNPAYIHIAQAIDRWNPQLIGEAKAFWGSAYGILPVHLLTGADYGASLLLLSILGGVLGVMFTYRLYGPAVAAWFVFVSPQLMERTLLGGPEPIFVGLFLASLVAIRKGSLGWAVLLASLAATVRPVGVFIVAAILLMTLRRRNWPKLVAYGSVAAGTAILYAIPMVLLTGSPFGNFSGYSVDWHHKIPITLPIYPLVEAALASQEPFTNTIKTGSWVLVVLFLAVYYGLIRGRLRAFFTQHPEETLACLLILLFQLSYNSQWAWYEFPRFIAPLLPFLLAQAGVKKLRRGWLLAAAPVFGGLCAEDIAGLHGFLQAFHGLIGR